MNKKILTIGVPELDIRKFALKMGSQLFYELGIIMTVYDRTEQCGIYYESVGSFTHWHDGGSTYCPGGSFWVKDALGTIHKKGSLTFVTAAGNDNVLRSTRRTTLRFETFVDTSITKNTSCGTSHRPGCHITQLTIG